MMASISKVRIIQFKLKWKIFVGTNIITNKLVFNIQILCGGASIRG